MIHSKIKLQTSELNSYYHNIYTVLALRNLLLK